MDADDHSLLNIGKVLSIRGSVIDVEFNKKLPPIFSLLHGKGGKISIEILSHLNSHSVRGIALTPTQGLGRGDEIEDTGGPLKVPVGKEILSRMFNVFGETIDLKNKLGDVEWRSIHRSPPPLSNRSTKSEIFETGIKVIDVLVPLERGGKAQRDVYRAVTGNLKLSYAQFEELETFAQFGARIDEDTREIIEHGKRIRACFKQPEFSPVSVPEQIIVLLVLSAGLFDVIPLEQVSLAELALQKSVKHVSIEILKQIDNGKVLTDKHRENIIETARMILNTFQSVKKVKS